MKTIISGGFSKAWILSGIRWLAGLMVMTMVLGSARATVVTTLGGYPSGSAVLYPINTFHVPGGSGAGAQFNIPSGIALDPSGTNLFLADYNNNAVRLITKLGDKVNSLTYCPYIGTDGINHPIGVAVDAASYVYVLNQGSGTNGTVLEFDGGLYANYFIKSLIATNATHLTNATALALDGVANIFVTVQSNRVIRITSTNLATVGVITNRGVDLRGIVVLQNGKIALTDAGNNGVWIMDSGNPSISNNAVKFTGFNGAGDTNGPANYASFNSPRGVAKAGNNYLVVADYGNNKVKTIDANGAVSRLFGVSSSYWSGSYQGLYDGTVNPLEQQDPVQARTPFGLAVGNDGAGNAIVYDTEVNFAVLREATGTGLLAPLPWPPTAPQNLAATPGYGQITLSWSTVGSATSYSVKRSLTNGGPYLVWASVSTTGYTDTNVLNGTNYYYVVSASNAGGEGPDSSEVTAASLAPPAPKISSISAVPGQVSLTWTPVVGATYYVLERSTSTNGYTIVVSQPGTSYTDTTGIVNNSTYNYVVYAANSGGLSPVSGTASITVPLPPAPNPVIGYITFPTTGGTTPTSVLVPTAYFPMNSYTAIVISEPAGNPVNYYFAPTSTNDASFTPTNFPNSAPPGYADGKDQAEVSQYDIYSIIQQYPAVTVWAVAAGQTNPPPQQSSAVVMAQFKFVAGNPTVNGTNAALFTITDPATPGAYYYYTTDGSDPLTSSSRTYIPANQVTNGFSIKADTLFKVRAFYANYQPSDIVSNLFTLANYQNNTISFGFASGEASSVFLASPGQTFYAPVTLSTVGNPTVLSLQFNLTVTNATATNPVTGYGFSTMLLKPIPGVTPVAYETIPPAMFVTAPVPNPVTLDGSSSFSSLIVSNTSLNLLGVGWLERAGATNLFNTLSQTLTTFSQAHDDMFPTALNPNGVILGGYNVQIPTNAQSGDTYQIQIGRPSATSDGIGAAASKVVTIDAPTNGAPISALKYVTVTNFIPYLVGSVYPFRWFNAGDFGTTNLVAGDVAQVFEAAVYPVNSPAFQAPGSDFFDAMDSCGNLGVLDTDPADPNYNYYTNYNNSLTTPAQLNALFDGTINQVAFGDGTLDVSDVYVTYRRSLDPSLTWFRRFWNNGQRVADTGITNHAANATSKLSFYGGVQAKNTGVSAPAPLVNFSAGDVIGAAGQTVQIPINATIYGNYPLRLLMLNLTVVPLDGSPALTSAVQFAANPVLGAPHSADSKGNGNFSAVWLNSTNAGLTGTVTLGTLTVIIPAGASTNAAYAVHFDHASASPNGLGSFPKQTLTGLLTLNGRTNSTYGDGIPDSWRLRWFGTTNNLLSVSNACPSGDGVNNWKKYVAGVNPNTANDFPSLKSKTPVPSGSTSAIHWPTVSGKQYVIERSTSLFPGVWSAISTNTGTGADLEFDDINPGAVKFYRVRILP
jgi:hypothetical protein